MRNSCVLSAFAWRMRVAREYDGGIDPHGDRKSPERIDYKRVVVRPLRKRVRKRLEAKGLNDGNTEKGEAGERYLGIKSGLELRKHGKG